MTYRILLLAAYFFSNLTNAQWNLQNPLPSEYGYIDAQILNENTVALMGIDETHIFFDNTSNGGEEWYQGARYPNYYNFNAFYITDNANWVIADGAYILRIANGYYWLQVVPPAFNLNDIVFTDSRNGWIAGNSGRILKKNFNDDYWSAQNSSVQENLNSVFFLDSLNGWAAGDNGVIINTNDGGITWIQQTTNITETILDLFFYDQYVGLAVGTNGTILRTTNNGQSWEEIVSNYEQDFSSISGYGNIAVAVSINGITFRTTDTGITWRKELPPTPYNLNKVKFYSQSFGWLVGDGYVRLKTTDLGESWRPTYASPRIQTLSFKSENIGYVAGQSRFLKTTDGGNNWVSCLPPDAQNSLFKEIAFGNENVGLATTDFSLGTLYRTSDGGNSWTQIMQNFFTINDIFFATDSLVFFVDENGGLRKSTDSGVTWTSKLIDTDKLYRIQFIDENIGWILGRDNLYKTTDGGDNWTLFTNLTSGCSNIFFINQDVGWAALQYATGYLKTTDGGNSWISYNTNYLITDIYFINELEGWSIGESGKILKTSDGGESWEQQLTGVYNYLWAMNFVTSTTGWIAGGHVLLKTTNGGVTYVENKLVDKVPANFLLSQNYPNPFNPSTKIEYSIPQSSNVIIKVFDVLGNEIESLVNEEKHSGTYEVTWYAEGLPSGVYFYQIRAGDFVETKKMILMK